MSSKLSPNQRSVTLVIPGHNSAATVRQCLTAVKPILDDAESQLAEVIFVDDGSTDDTAAIVQQFDSVRLLQQPAGGPSAARNAGWRSANTPLIWFIDADCVAEPDALRLLLPHMTDATVGGVSGSYGIANSQSLLARLIHEEIVERHLSMSSDVNFLASFNVLYRAAALEQLCGFDERYRKGQDAELSFRVLQAGYRLRFEIRSRVKHFHEQQLFQYFRTQRAQGRWRVFLHMEHCGHSAGDSYSSLIDHLQPPLAMLTLAACIFPIAAIFSPGALPILWWLAYLPLLCVALLMAMQLPMMIRLIRRVRRPDMFLYAPFGFLRAFWRGAGMTAGFIRYFARSHRNTTSTPSE